MNHYKIWVVHDAGSNNSYELGPRVYMDRWVCTRSSVSQAVDLKADDVGLTSVHLGTHFISEYQAKTVVYYLSKLFPLRQFVTVKFVTKMITNRKRKAKTKTTERVELTERRLDTHL